MTHSPIEFSPLPEFSGLNKKQFEDDSLLSILEKLLMERLASEKLNSLEKEKKPEQSEKRVDWKTDIKSAYKEAMDKQLPLIVRFKEDWCGACQAQERTTLSSAEFQKLADQAVFVSADPSKDDQSNSINQLMADLDINSYPTLVVLKATPTDLIEQARLVGNLPQDLYVSKIKESIAPRMRQDLKDDSPWSGAAMV